MASTEGNGGSRQLFESKPERGAAAIHRGRCPACRPARAGTTQLGQRARGVVSLHLRTLAREGRMTVTIGRRELLAALGGGAVAWLAGIPCYCGREPHDDLRGSP